MGECMRDAAFERHRYLLNGCVKRNLPLIMALQLEIEDVVQDLSIRLIRAIDRFDNKNTCTLPKFLYHELQYEILDIRRRHKPFGIRGVPKDLRLDVIYLDQPQHDGTYYEITSQTDFYDDTSDALDSLTKEERSVVVRKMNGEAIRKKVDRKYLENARKTLSEYFYNMAKERTAKTERPL